MQFPPIYLKTKGVIIRLGRRYFKTLKEPPGSGIEPPVHPAHLDFARKNKRAAEVEISVGKWGVVSAGDNEPLSIAGICVAPGNIHASPR